MEILKGIKLEVKSGEFLILVGPSGCGNSTLLNMISFGLQMRKVPKDKQDEQSVFVLPVRKQADRLRAWLGRDIVLGIRPEQITDAQQARGDHDVHRQRIKLGLTEPTGADTLAFVRLNGTNVCCRVRPDQCPPAGRAMELHFDLSKAVFFEPGSEKRVA